MRGRCAALAIAALTCELLKTLHEHTIINHPNQAGGRRSKCDFHSLLGFCETAAQASALRAPAMGLEAGSSVGWPARRMSAS